MTRYLSEEQFGIILDTLNAQAYVTPGKGFKVLGKELFTIDPESKNFLFHLLLSLGKIAQGLDEVRFSPKLQDLCPPFYWTTLKLSIEAYIIDKYDLSSLIEEDEEIVDGVKLGMEPRLLPLDSYEDYFIPVIEYLSRNKPKSDTGDDDISASSLLRSQPMNIPEVLEKFKHLIPDPPEEEEEGSGEEKEKEELKAGSGPLQNPESIVPVDPSRLFSLFLSSLIDRRKRFEVDPLKHYNRNSRGSRDLMYSSIRKKVKTGQMKLGILLDVSGSIPVEIVSQAVSTLQSLVPLLDKDSTVLMWDTRYVDNVDLYSLDKIKAGDGGTELARGLKWLRERGYRCIVVYSDFYLNDEPRFREELKRCTKEGIKVHFFPTEEEPGGYDLRYLQLWRGVSGKGRSPTPSM